MAMALSPPDTRDLSDTNGGSPLIGLREIEKRYPGRDVREAALNKVTLTINRGERIGVMGRSGSGKSTLLNILAALTWPTSGRYEFDGAAVSLMGVNSRGSIRLRRRTGYVGQTSDLLGNFDVRSNVRLAAACRKQIVTDDEVCSWLERVGLADKARDRPSQLSGGERQRVNIARALACKPLALFADEPTGSLDLHTSRRVLDLMHKLAKETKTTLILVTHVPDYAAECERQLCLRNGSLYHDECGMSRGSLVDFIEGA